MKKFEMAELFAEKFDVLDVITASGEGPSQGENETPTQPGDWD